MAFVFSPSNMATYKLCPRRFQAQSITKEIQWKASKAKSRGSLIHTTVETAMKHGTQAVTSWPEGMDTFYTQQQVQDSRKKFVADGAASQGRLFIEHELCVNSKFKPSGWWDDDTLLRAKADTLILAPGVADLIDYKSGRIYDREAFQLRVEALLVHLVYRINVVGYSYWYVDVGESVDGSIDFTNGLMPVQDIINLMRDMKISLRDSYFPSVKNKFCGWCDFNKTPKCGL